MQPRCGVCGEAVSPDEAVPAVAIRPRVARALDRMAPDWRAAGWICPADLARARHAYVSELLEHERGELDTLDQSVVAALARQETATRDVETEFDRHTTFGERLADRVAAFGGSWTFIILFCGTLVAWMIVNTLVILSRQPFDPYPFILLNLVLSCIAALQAPLIMMSQRRQEAKDRLRARNDYRVNLKAELEIRQLHEKIDHMLLRQWERLAEIQQLQIDMMEEVARARRG
jgi:uncharacterized membrane protein